jgi:hypothetical protein
MRLIIPAVAGAFAVCTVSLTPGFAAPRAQPVTQSFNACVALAKQRGFTTQDLETSGTRLGAARAFVLRCMQGRQR